jgi:hypothetical protein
MATYTDNLVDQYDRPIIGALISAVQSGSSIATATTDALGQFTITAPDGVYTLQVRINGSLVLEYDNTIIGAAAIQIAPIPIQSILQFGAIGNGVTDDTAAVARAFAAGIALSGADKTYAVSGNIALPAGLTLSDAAFKQLAPNSTTRRTLYAAGVDAITLTNVKVDLNGTGTEGALTTSAGVWIEGGKNHRVTGLEVTGNSRGSGAAFVSCTNSDFVDIFVHDMAYSNTGAIDDQLMGVWLANTSGCTLDRARVDTLNGNATGADVRRFTRGIVASGNTNLRIVNFFVRNCDQLMDCTGSAPNIGIVIGDGYGVGGYIFGVKIANSGAKGSCTNVQMVDCGIAGFVASGPSEAALPTLTGNFTFSNCTAIRTGSNGQTVNTNYAGFAVQSGSFNTDTPKGIRFIGCLALDDATVPTMKYGFLSSVAPTQGEDTLNEAIDCRSLGHTVAAMSGMSAPICGALGTNAAASIPNNTATDLNFDNEIFDGASMHSNSVNNNIFVVPQPGYYLVSANVVFAANATGYRQVSALVNGGAVAGATTQIAAASGSTTAVPFSALLYIAAGGNVRLQVTQTSGGALTVDMTKTRISVSLQRYA